MKKFNPFLFTPNVRFTENTHLRVCCAKKDNRIYLEEGLTGNPRINWEQSPPSGITVLYKAFTPIRPLR